METVILSKWELANILFGKGESWLTLPNGEPVSLRSVERESGSGRTFNLTVQPVKGEKFTVFARTKD